jgi:hypothetical protein
MQNDNVKLKNFTTLEFPRNISVVYVIYFTNQKLEIPFYAGETGRLLGRVSDYMIANFKASTDFKVGEAIKYLQDKGHKIEIKYKETNERKIEQDKIIKKFQDLGIRLLNELKGYDYKIADIKQERQRIINFCNILIKNNFKF